MHEAGLVKNLVRKAEDVVIGDGGTRATSVEVRQGVFAHISPEHLRHHFDLAAMGTRLEGARLRVVQSGDDADLVLLSVTVEDA